MYPKRLLPHAHTPIPSPNPPQSPPPPPIIEFRSSRKALKNEDHKQSRLIGKRAGNFVFINS